MDFRQLRYFTTIIEKKSYTKAARTLHISQPSLSNMIKKLEKEVGFQLLERSTRELNLTESGAILYQRAVELLNQLDHVKRELEDVKKTGAGNISIGLIESTKNWLPKVIKTFKKPYPNVHIQLNEILGKEKIYQSLKNYDIHFAITNQFIESPNIIIYPIYKESLVLVTSNNHPLNNKEKIELSDLVKQPFIISKPGFQTREDILNAFSLEGLRPTIHYEIERFETACSLVGEGLGITILPESYLKYSSENKLHIQHINNPALTRSVYLAYFKDRYQPPIVYDLCDRIRHFFDS